MAQTTCVRLCLINNERVRYCAAAASGFAWLHERGDWLDFWIGRRAVGAGASAADLATARKANTAAAARAAANEHDNGQPNTNDASTCLATHRAHAGRPSGGCGLEGGR